MLDLFAHLPRFRPRVLVADDDPTFRLFLCHGFARTEVEILEAKDGAEALQIGLNEHIDLALVDVLMPQADGLEVCRALRQRFSSSELPILLVTGSDEVETIMRGFEAGCSDFISKPVNVKVLRERIKAWLERQREHRMLADLAKLLQRGLVAGQLDFVWYQTATQRMVWSSSFQQRTGFSERSFRDADRLAALVRPEDRAAFRRLLHGSNEERTVQIQVSIGQQARVWAISELPEYRTDVGVLLLIQDVTETVRVSDSIGQDHTQSSGLCE